MWLGRNPNLRLPFAGELQGALADGGAEGLVGGAGVEPFGLRLVVVSQEVKQHDARASGHPRTITRSRVVLLPFAGELQGALADGFAEGLV